MKTILGKVMKISWTTALCAALAVMVVATVGMASPATAAKAKKATFKLGKTNPVKAVSAMVGSVTGPLLKLDNGGGPALDLKVAQGQAPMTVGSDTKVDNLNADKIDGLDSSELAGPQGEQGLKGDKGDTGAQGLQGPAGSGGDADTLDGKDSTAFANGTNGKANDADKLDGKDQSAFFSGETYESIKTISGPGGGAKTQLDGPVCDAGDKTLSGGHNFAGEGSESDNVLESRALVDNGWVVRVQDNPPANDFDVFVLCADFPPLR